MIHYDLLCAGEHRFDGWFKDSVSFDEQAARGLLECPVCGGTEVRRALMAPAVPRRRGRSRTPEVAPPAEGQGETRRDEAGEAAPATAGAQAAVPAGKPNAVAGANMPAQLRAMLQKLRAEVEQRCDYVGPAFADTARRIHNGEIAARGIYGETTPEQAEALREDGIEVASIPWLPRADG